MPATIPTVARRPHDTRLPAALFAALVTALAGCSDTDTLSPSAPEAEAIGTEGVEASRQSADAGATLTTATTFFVSPSGSDANAGTQAKPFKTIAKALSLAKAGDIVRLGPGTYSKAATGEQFTAFGQQVLVPAGVTIVGALDGPTRLSVLQGGVGETGLNFRGSATVKNLDLRGFQTAVKAVKGTQALSNLLLSKNGAGLNLADSAQATLTGSTVLIESSGTVSAAEVGGRARFTMSGGKISATAASCGNDAFGVLLHGRGQATLKGGAILENVPGAALDIEDSSKVTLNTATITRTYPDGCAPTIAAVSLFDSGALTLTNAFVLGHGGSHTTGLETNGGGQVTIDNTEIAGFTETGIAVRAANSKITARNQSLFAHNHIGIDARFATAASLVITNTLLGENDVAIIAAKARVRTSTFTDNREANVLANGAGVDLGTTLSPGSNVLHRAALGGGAVTFLGSQFPGAVNAGTIKAAGNAWEPSTQGTDASGHYTTHTLLDGTSSAAHGVNFDLPNANTKIQL